MKESRLEYHVLCMLETVLLPVSQGVWIQEGNRERGAPSTRLLRCSLGPKMTFGCIALSTAGGLCTGISSNACPSRNRLLTRERELEQFLFINPNYDSQSGLWGKGDEEKSSQHGGERSRRRKDRESEVTFRRNQEYSLLLLHAQKALPPDSEKQ